MTTTSPRATTIPRRIRSAEARPADTSQSLSNDFQPARSDVGPSLQVFSYAVCILLCCIFFRSDAKFFGKTLCEIGSAAKSNLIYHFRNGKPVLFQKSCSSLHPLLAYKADGRLSSELFQFAIELFLIHAKQVAQFCDVELFKKSSISWLSSTIMTTGFAENERKWFGKLN